MYETIVSAFIGGLVAAASKVATTAVEDAYGALKRLLVRKLGPESKAVKAVADLEDEPDSEAYRAVVAEKLKAAKVENDPDLLEAAQSLQVALDQLPPDARTQVQNVQRAVGNYIAQASGGSVAKVNVGGKLN